MIKNKKHFITMNAVYAMVLVLVLIINMVAGYWGQALIQVFGYVGADHVDTLSSDNLYYSSDYTEEELRAAQHGLAHKIASSGSVLLQNDNNTLPLAAGASVTVFNEASAEWLINGTGSSAIGTEDYLYVTVKWSLEQAGFSVNEAVWDWYSGNGMSRGGGSATGDWSINEASWDTVTQAVGGEGAYDGYQDVALIVVGRTGGEGADLATSMENHGGTADQSYLELTPEELSILANVKAAGFEKVVVIVNSANPVEMGFLNDYDVDACMWVGPTGAYGLEALGALLAGTETPSGHMTDTLVYDVFSSPAMQNFGNTRYIDANGQAYGSRYNYVSYNEGIYVGYRYYETRYEDSVMGTASVGDYTYENEVAFPFGYGLSYTTFDWSNYQMSEADGVVTVTVDVTNTGDCAGSDAVEVYYQSPYTVYDKANNVEKAAIELAAFAKTDSLQPGATETVTIAFPVTYMKSYDYTTAKTYIMDEGDYYITAGQDSHDALNNILVAKGYSVDGDSAMVNTYTADSFQTLSADDATSTEVTNQFDDAYGEAASYLSRQNWSMMDNNGISYSTDTVVDNGVTYPARFADSVLIANIDTKNWASSGRPASADNDADIVVGQDNGLSLIDLLGADYDDEQWVKLLQEVKISEMHTMWNKGGYTTSVIETINKPLAASTDGPAGLSMFMSGWGCFNYCTEYLLACTWDADLAAEMGELVGEDSLHSNIVGWFAPAMNLHRTPFGGRCFEYFSEDPVLSGVMGAAICDASVSKGMITYIKHFALNEQDTNRNSISTWANEQSIRELYLAPFEITIKTSDCNGLMSSYNNIGYRDAKGSYALLTAVLRDEWGFGGIVLTDLATDSGEANDMSLAAGVDLQLTTGINALSTTKENRIRNALSLATKRVCYNVVNSSAMNGMEGGTAMVSSGTPTYTYMLLALNVIAGLGLVCAEIFTVRKCRVAAPVLSEAETKARRKKRTITAIVTAVVIVVILVVAVMYIDAQMIGESVFDYIFG